MGITKIIASTNGEIALQKLKLQKADLIISDWHMPIMDGLEFYKAVKKEVDLQDIPFLMVTVEDSKERVVEALKLGIRDYIVKPLSSKSFEGVVKPLRNSNFFIKIFPAIKKRTYVRSRKSLY